jgi:hypothetical protein
MRVEVGNTSMPSGSPGGRRRRARPRRSSSPASAVDDGRAPLSARAHSSGCGLGRLAGRKEQQRRPSWAEGLF